jgi:hypothetical protein
MRFTVQYIPLSKIEPNFPAAMTPHLKRLRNMLWDCMHLLVVRKSRKDGNYMILIGNERYEFLRKHTKKLVAPCLVDESMPKTHVKSWLDKFRSNRFTRLVPSIRPHRMTPVALSITRTFLKEEPRFQQLTRRQQIQVLILAIRYKKIVLASMKSKMDQISS